MPATPKFPIYVPTRSYVGSKPFEGDLFDRHQLADRLTGLIDRMQEGCVFAIEAPWGEGKTWFGRNWEAQLKAKHRTIYIDAFQQDYADDPFLLIASEIMSSIAEPSTRDKFAEGAKKVGKALLPLAAKVAIATGSRLLLGPALAVSDVQQEIGEEVGEAAKKYIEERLKEHQRERESVKQMNEALTEFAGAQEKPVVVFIDELDRCKPTFAVQTLERIKHFFDVPRLVFVLLLNRSQIEASIRGVYGSSVEAGAYLGKFIQFFLRLPKSDLPESERNFAYTYCSDLEKRYGLGVTDGAADFREAFSALALALRLSLRDLERGYVLFSFGQPISSSASFAAYVIALKIAMPDLLYSLVRGERSAHEQAATMTKAWLLHTDSWTIKVMNQYHSGFLTGFNNIPEELGHAIQHFRRIGINHQNLIRVMVQKIDLLNVR